MYRRVLLRPQSQFKMFVRYNSDKRITDFLRSPTMQKEESSQSEDMLDDLSTFGSILNTSSAKPKEEFDTDLELSRLIEDIYLESSPLSKERSRGSVHDKDVFDKLFESILTQGESKKKTTTELFASEPKFNSDGNVNFSLLRRHSLEREEPSAPNSYKESKLLKLKVINALKPTFNIINEMETNKELIDYFKNKVILRFQKELENGDLKENKPTEELLNDMANMNPEKPLLNKIVLPVLTEYVLKTLADNYHSAQEAISLFHSFKGYPQFYLRASNTDIYNVLLRISWTSNKNVEDIKHIIKDMLLNGFPGDLKTIKILSEIKLEVMKALSTSDKDLFINKFEKYRYHYLVDIDKRMKQLTKLHNP